MEVLQFRMGRQTHDSDTKQFTIKPYGAAPSPRFPWEIVAGIIVIGGIFFSVLGR